MKTNLDTIHDFISVFCYIKIFALLTKCEGWVDIGQVVLCILIDPDKVEVIKNIDQYPAILPKQAWSIMKYLLCSQENYFLKDQLASVIQRVDDAGRD